MMRFAEQAARYLPDAEIIEMHHERKLDAPSGTAAKTAEMIAQGRAQSVPTALPPMPLKRYPGRVAARAQALCRPQRPPPGLCGLANGDLRRPRPDPHFRHDSLDRKSFMPGVLLAVRHAPHLQSSGGELVYGLEHLL